ncbi:MAG TPA: magnesium/cobalt transporter CorA [Acidimicrobiales bacterium]|jgi:magnesium transporter|nr:magnesium/cobalt transporter CorA [Acidimicrobiales bacterium]
MNVTITQGGQTITATKDDIVAALNDPRLAWIDLDPGDAGDRAALADMFEPFGFHPLAVEDAEEFGQRPKLDDYDDYTYMVAHGAIADGNGTMEVHLFFSERFVVTVHHGPCAVFDQVHKRIAHYRATDVTAPHMYLVYFIVDALTDSYFPVLSAFDDRVDALEDAILQRPTEEQLGELFAMKRSLLAMRKAVTPQRDMFAGLASGVTTLPGMTTENTRYFRDLYDHLIRISDLVDSYRDLLSGVMDTHISTVSNRLNVVMKQLAIIATIFLPLTFLSGFFGQNFPWLIGHLGGGWVFLIVGIGTEVLAVVVLAILFKKRGWLGGPSA